MVMAVDVFLMGVVTTLICEVVVNVVVVVVFWGVVKYLLGMAVVNVVFTGVVKFLLGM